MQSILNVASPENKLSYGSIALLFLRILKEIEKQFVINVLKIYNVHILIKKLLILSIFHFFDDKSNLIFKILFFPSFFSVFPKRKVESPNAEEIALFFNFQSFQLLKEKNRNILKNKRCISRDKQVNTATYLTKQYQNIH